MKITNTQAGPRGFNSVAGPMLVDPGETVEAKIFAREKEHLEATQWFKMSGSYEPNPTVDGGAAAVLEAPAGKKGEAMAKRLEETEALVSELQAENAQLKEALEAKGGNPSNGGGDPGFVASHRGGGRYFVMDGANTVGEAMTKEDAEAFNALSDEDKAAYLAKG
jgi:hypothetical protein